MKKRIVGVIIFLILIASSTISHGALSAKATATASKGKIKPGETITITLKVSDIAGSIQGVSGVELSLKYDKDVFEQVKQSDISSSWQINYVPATEFLAVEGTTAISTGTAEIWTITLKAKENAKEGTTVIEFLGGKVYNLDESQSVSIQPVIITVEKDQQVQPPPEPTPEPNPAPNPTPNPTPNPEELPKTGIEETVMFGVVIFGIFSLAGYVGMVKMRHIK